MKAKITEYLEVTNNRNEDWPDLMQVRLTKRLPYRSWIPVGSLGGWVASLDNLEDEAWIDEDVLIFGEDVRIRGRGAVFGKVKLAGSVEIRNNASVTGGNSYYLSMGGKAIVEGGAILMGNISVNGGVVFGGNAYVRGDGSYPLIISGDRIEILGEAVVKGYGAIYSDTRIEGGIYRGDLYLHGAHLSEAAHYLSMGPMGSEDQMAVLYRIKENVVGRDHRLTIGCWTGSVEDLEAVVEERSLRWDADEEQKTLWKNKYALLKQMCEMTIEGWNK